MSRWRLRDQGVAVTLTADGERAGPASVHHVAVVLHLRLEVTVDEVRHDHILFKNGQALVGPHFGNEGVVAGVSGVIGDADSVAGNSRHGKIPRVHLVVSKRDRFVVEKAVSP